MLKTDPPIIVEQELNATMELVWSIITKLDHMKNWFFAQIPSFNAEVGFETNFIIQHHGRSFDHQWKIIHVEKERSITYNWRYQGYGGDSTVQFELIPKGANTIIKLTAEVLEDFPQHIPEFKRESCVGGWNYFIQQSLPEYIDSL